jgi:hypothetical protein
MAQENKIEIFENTLLKLLLRRGSDLDRRQIILTEGELGYTVDTRRVYVGDGETKGGVIVGNKFLGSVNTAELASLTQAVTGDTAYDQEEKKLYTFLGGPEAQWLQVADKAGDRVGVDVLQAEKDAWDDNYSWTSSQSSNWVAGTAQSSENQPTDPSIGDFWFNPFLNKLYIWSGVEWAEVTGSGVSIQTGQPSNPNNGDFWFDTNNDALYIYSDEWVRVGGIDSTSNIQVQSINASGQISSDSITTGTVNADTVNADTVNADNINVGGNPVITTGTIPNGRKNKLDNGNFDIWQRAVEYEQGASPYYPGTKQQYLPGADGKFYRQVVVADRMISGVNANSTGSWKVTRENCTGTELANFNAAYFMRLTTNNVGFSEDPNTSIDKNIDGKFCLQNIEGARNILGKTVTLSFWARASQNTKLVNDPQIHAVGWRTSGSVNVWTPSMCKTFNVTPAWQKFTQTWTFPTYDQLIAAGFNEGNADLQDKLANNEDVTTIETLINEYGINKFPQLDELHYQIDIKNLWSRANWKRHGNQLNPRPAGFEGGAQPEAEMEAMNDSFINTGWYDIAQVQLEEGEQATSFEHRSVRDELMACQRFYTKTFDQHVIPGDGTKQLRGRIHTHTAEAIKSTAHTVHANWPVTMASYPRMVTSYSPITNITDTIYIDTEGVTSANEFYNTTVQNMMSGVDFGDAGETGFSSCYMPEFRGTPLEGNNGAFRFVNLHVTAQVTNSW